MQTLINKLQEMKKEYKDYLNHIEDIQKEGGRDNFLNSQKRKILKASQLVIDIDNALPILIGERN